jgi:hypothetical protein
MMLRAASSPDRSAYRMPKPASASWKPACSPTTGWPPCIAVCGSRKLTAERFRISHFETGMLAKEGDRSFEMFRLVLEAREHATRDRAAPAMNKQICIADTKEMK